MAALAALGIAQPLLQLVSQNPEFLVVHHFGGVEVLIQALALLIIPPLLLFVVVLLAGLIRPIFGRAAHSLILGGLISLILLPIVEKIPGMGGWLTLVLAFVPASFLVLRLGQSLLHSRNLAFLALVVPLFLLMFLGATSIRALFASAESFPSSLSESPVHPVVLIVFDEFPTSSLLNSDLELDCELFPNFCRLAERAIWYPNATTVSGATLRSVPSIMTGKLPTWTAPPTLAAHPQNIFTLLASSHHISSLESQTNLCPEDLKSGPIPNFLERQEMLISDLFVLYEHILVPEIWRKNLVPVSNKWCDFRGAENESRSNGRPVTKIDHFNNFVNSIEIHEQPNLVVAHILLPHNPFNFFPNGTIYNWRKRVPTLPDGTWGNDNVLIAHSYRRHILQVVAVDQLLGNLLDRLEYLDLFDDAAMIITADHGVCFRSGLSGRHLNDGNEADIMSVPLFLKLPGQSMGRIDDRFAQSVDILPTLISALGTKSEWGFDGMDLLSKSPNRSQLDFKDQDTHQDRIIDPVKLLDRNEIVQWKHDLFGDEGSFERLFNLGDTDNLVGERIIGKLVKDHSSLQCEILDAEKLNNVNLGSLFVPAEFNGTLHGYDGPDRLKLALALNDVIVGVSETYLEKLESGIINWQITAPLSAFQNGSNRAELFLVSSLADGPRLTRVPMLMPSYLGVNVGGRPVSGIGEKGLFKSHNWDGQRVRWTNGSGRWDIPLKEGEKPRHLDIKIVSSGSSGGTLSVYVNGTQLLTEDLQRGHWETRISLESIKMENHLTVELISSVFVPAERDPNSKDHRELGVAVASLVVQ